MLLRWFYSTVTYCRYGALVVAVILAAGAMSPVDVEARQSNGRDDCPDTARRFVEGRSLVSEDLPLLRIDLDDSFSFIDRFKFTIRDVACGERFVFVDAEDGRIRRMIVAQFEYFTNEDGTYNYSFENAEVYAGHRFRSNPFAFGIKAARANNPGGEAVLTDDLLRERGFMPPSEMMSYRFLTVPDEERRHELILFYIEDLEPSGLTLDDLYDDSDEMTDGWSREAEALKRRALDAFSIR